MLFDPSFFSILHTPTGGKCILQSARENFIKKYILGIRNGCELMVHGGWFFGYCGSKVRGHSSHWMGDLVLTTAHSNKNSISYIYECVQNRSTDIISSDPNASCPCGIKEKG